MSGWARALHDLALRGEGRLDRWPRRADPHRRDRLPRIHPYRGCGDVTRALIHGRVLRDPALAPATDEDTLWDNLLATLARFATDEVAGARLGLRLGAVESAVIADDEGYFDALVEGVRLPREEGPVHGVELLLEGSPGGPGAVVRGEVVVPGPASRFVVVSDIDDTVVRTEATSLLAMARNVLLRNARSRLPFAGVGALFRALRTGAAGGEANPLLFLSSSPWNLYDLLDHYLELQGIDHPVLFLRDWGLDEEGLHPLSGHSGHKSEVLRRLFAVYPEMPFVLVGDSGQEDPEIYARAVREHPDRVLAVYIRNVSRDLDRPAAVHALAEEVLAAGSSLVLAENSSEIAAHAAAHGWIDAAALPAIGDETADDERQAAARPGPPPRAGRRVRVEEEGEAGVEEALAGAPGERAEVPTVVVERDRGGAGVTR